MSGQYRPEQDVVPSVKATTERNTLNKAGAEALARELDAWWHSRGYPQVRHWVEWMPYRVRSRSNEAYNSGVWVVRSNLQSGMPPKVVEAA